MKKVISLMFMALLYATFISCSSGNDEDELVTDLNELNFSGTSGDEVSLSIRCNTEWSISGIPSWLKASSTNGTGDAQIVFQTISENNSSEERTADIFVQAGGASKTVFVRQEGLNVPNCDVSTNRVVVLSDQFACDFNYDENVKYFYIARATSSWDDIMTDSEIIEKMKSDSDNRLSPKDEYVISFSGLKAKTKYFLYLVGFDKNGKHGNLIKTEIQTKSGTNQPQAFISNVRYNSTQWQWTTTINAYSDHYYQWFVADGLANSYSYSDAIIAWHFKKLMDENEDGLSPIKNSGDWHRKRNSNMFDLVTWAVGSNGELSGVINRYYGSVSSVSENSISKVGKSEPQIERVKIADLLK